MNIFICDTGIQVNTKLIQHKILPQPNTIMWCSILSRILGESIYEKNVVNLNKLLQKVFQRFLLALS